jgi:hypothetical protein
MRFFKDNPPKIGNSRFLKPPAFVNEFFRYNRQLRIGKIEHPDLDLFRREIEPMARRLIELCGPDWFSKLCAEEIRGKFRVI